MDLSQKALYSTEGLGFSTLGAIPGKVMWLLWLGLLTRLFELKTQVSPEPGLEVDPEVDLTGNPR